LNLSTLKPLCERCLLLSKQLTDPDKIKRVEGLIDTLLANVDWPDLKIGVWLGSAETILIENGVSSYEAERDFSRPIKHAYFTSIGEPIPATTNVMENE